MSWILPSSKVGMASKSKLDGGFAKYAFADEFESEYGSALASILRGKALSSRMKMRIRFRRNAGDIEEHFFISSGLGQPFQFKPRL
jgi:hypothetical protein